MKTNLEPELSATIVKFKLLNRTTKEVYDALWDKHRISIAQTPAGDAEGLRISPHVYNSLQEIDTVVNAIKELAG